MFEIEGEGDLKGAMLALAVEFAVGVGEPESVLADELGKLVRAMLGVGDTDTDQVAEIIDKNTTTSKHTFLDRHDILDIFDRNEVQAMCVCFCLSPELSMIYRIN